MMANQVATNGTFTSCGMGVWNTIKRPNKLTLDDFLALDFDDQVKYLKNIRDGYYGKVSLDGLYKDAWFSENLITHFISDCAYLAMATEAVTEIPQVFDNAIFENGQGLLLSDPGWDKLGTTPSKTGLDEVIKIMPKGIDSCNVHYVTRSYLTRHGADDEFKKVNTSMISSDIHEDRTNHFNQFQGEFKYGFLDIEDLKYRVNEDFNKLKINGNMIIDVTHCDEMDRAAEFSKTFKSVNFIEKAEIMG